MTAYSDGRGRWPTLLAVIGALFVAVVLARDCNYDGGWSLRSPDNSSCPAGAPQECGKAGNIQLRCCPDQNDGYSCQGGSDSYKGNFCCKGSPGECLSAATDTPKCPDPSWSLWRSDQPIDISGGWCCSPSQKGVYRNEDGSKNYFCTPSAEATLPPNFFMATSVAVSCSATATPTPSDRHKEGSSGMSGGAIAGAVVGGVAGLALIGAGIFFFVRRMRRPTVNAAQTVTTEDGTVRFVTPGAWNEGKPVSLRRTSGPR